MNDRSAVYAVIGVLQTPRIDVVQSNILFFKQKTAYEMRISDWSSDVCSSDLRVAPSFFDTSDGMSFQPRLSIAARNSGFASPAALPPASFRLLVSPVVSPSLSPAPSNFDASLPLVPGSRMRTAVSA